MDTPAYTVLSACQKIDHTWWPHTRLTRQMEACQVGQLVGVERLDHHHLLWRVHTDHLHLQVTIIHTDDLACRMAQHTAFFACENPGPKYLPLIGAAHNASSHMHRCCVCIKQPCRCVIVVNQGYIPSAAWSELPTVSVPARTYLVPPACTAPAAPRQPVAPLRCLCCLATALLAQPLEKPAAAAAQKLLGAPPGPAAAPRTHWGP